MAVKPKMALYARISKGVNVQNQLLQLKRWARGNNEMIIVGKPFVDRLSSRDRRPKKEEVLKLLRQGQLGGVAFTSLDRWGRTLSELVLDLEEAQRRKWVFVSLKEGLHFDTAAGMMYASMLAVFASFERERTRERTLAGLERARREGKRIGRHPTNCQCVKHRKKGQAAGGGGLSP